MTGASGGASVVSAGGPASTAEGGKGPPSSGHDHSDTFDVQAINDPELSDFLKFLVEGEDDGVGAPRMAPPGASTLSEDLSKVWEALENGDDIMGAPIGQTLVARAARSGKTFNSEDLQRAAKQWQSRNQAQHGGKLNVVAMDLAMASNRKNIRNSGNENAARENGTSGGSGGRGLGLALGVRVFSMTAPPQSSQHAIARVLQEARFILLVPIPTLLQHTQQAGAGAGQGAGSRRGHTQGREGRAGSHGALSRRD